MDEVILSRIRQEAYEQGYQDGKVDGYNLAGTQMSVAKQERKKGKWIENTEYLPISYTCPFCGHTIYGDDTNFCDECGADMREETEDERSDKQTGGDRCD